MAEILFFMGGVFVISLSGAMMPGPVTTIVVSKGQQNKYAGLYVSMGHFLIEAPLILLIGLGFGSFFEAQLTKILISSIGGVMIILMGISLIKNRNKLVYEEKKSNKNILWGGIVGSLNPYFFIWWATLGSALIMKSLSFGITIFIFFIIVHSSTDLIWHLILSTMVFKSKKIMKNNTPKIILAICGGILILFGIYFLGSIVTFL